MHFTRALDDFIGVQIKFMEDSFGSWIILQLFLDFINQCIYNWLGINASCLAKVLDCATPQVHYGISRLGRNIFYVKKG